MTAPHHDGETAEGRRVRAYIRAKLADAERATPISPTGAGGARWQPGELDSTGPALPWLTGTVSVAGHNLQGGGHP